MATRTDAHRQVDPDVAAWQGDRSLIWTLVIVLFGLIASVALLVEFGSGFIAWVLFIGALLVVWLIAVFFNVPRSASYNWKTPDHDPDDLSSGDKTREPTTG